MLSYNILKYNTLDEITLKYSLTSRYTYSYNTTKTPHYINLYNILFI